MKFSALMRALINDMRGNFAVAGALLLPALASAGLLSVDFASVAQQRSSLQQAADAAAAGSARELLMGRISAMRVQSVAESIAGAKGATAGGVGGGLKVATALVDNNTGVHVKLTRPPTTQYMQMFGIHLETVSAEAIARVVGGGKLCVLTLDVNQPTTVWLTKKAKLTANDCAVYSNSSSRTALVAQENAVLTAGLICAVGGNAIGKGNYFPEPMTDCPSIADPMEKRPMAPISSVCTATNLKINTGVVTLTPGTYCGGIKISGDAVVDLRPGIYVIKDGPLVVTDTAQMKGRYVNFTFPTAKNLIIELLSGVHFTKDAVIDIGAPKDGPMAGVLMYEERATKANRIYRITSDNARVLLGTIYLPQGTLHIDSNNPVADRSEYTALVVRRLILSEGPNLVINSDYSATDVPVPTGLGNTAMTAKIYLGK
ncbi:MAG: pilus assembly protein [Hyphomicrobiaceae bacterium]|nr:pilus assembly protein [Hyphomicrobiaceae bacterium]